MQIELNSNYDIESFYGEMTEDREGRLNNKVVLCKKCHEPMTCGVCLDCAFEELEENQVNKRKVLLIFSQRWWYG
jgi:hypothetical protein